MSVLIFYKQEDQEAVTPMLYQIYQLEEEQRKIEDEVVDSDNEYVKDSNYTGIKQVCTLLIVLSPYILINLHKCFQMVWNSFID